MKNTTLLILLSTFSFGFSQTWTTGVINLSTNYDAKIDITATQVTLTLNAPDNIWFGIGFGGSSMDSSDIFRTNGTTIVDASPTFHDLPTADTNQDWTLGNNTTSGGIRTIVAHRALNTGESGDHVFSTSDTSISLIWAKGSSTSYAYHASRGITAAGITLGIDDYALSEFKIYPNPSKTIMNLQFPHSITRAQVEVFDGLGRQIYNNDYIINTPINISQWASGMYLVKMSVNNRIKTKKFIKQ